MLHLRIIHPLATFQVDTGLAQIRGRAIGNAGEALVLFGSFAMNRFAPLILLAMLGAGSAVSFIAHGNVLAASTTHAAGLIPSRFFTGEMIYAANGRRLGPVDRVTADGSVQLILADRLLTLPPAILNDVDGKLTATHSRGDLLR